MMTRIAMALGMAALLIPVSMLFGLSAGKSILVSTVTAVLFLLFNAGMSKIFKKTE